MTVGTNPGSDKEVQTAAVAKYTNQSCSNPGNGVRLFSTLESFDALSCRAHFFSFSTVSVGDTSLVHYDGAGRPSSFGILLFPPFFAWLEIFHMSQLHFVPYLQNEKAGIIVVSVFSLLSSLALGSVALRVFWLAVRRCLSSDHPTPEYVFFNTQLGHYATCLIVANLFIEVSGLIGIRWLIQNGITTGGICMIQAILSQMGNWATAYFTVTIAVHTFNSLVLRKRQSILICATTISLGWILAGLLAGAPCFNPRAYKSGPPFGADGLSCGISPVYLKAQFFFHLFPIFLSSVLSATLYSVTFLVLRGTLSIKGGITLTLDPNERWVAGKVTENYHRFVARIARSMLWYPVVYIILLIPYSVTRLLRISGWFVPFGLLVFAYTCWYMLGVVNVLLLYNTFHVLGPAFDDRRSSTAKSANESFGTPEQARQSKALRGSYKKKADPRTRPAPLLSSPLFEHTRVRSEDRPLLLVYPDRTASAQNFHGHTHSLPSGHATLMPVASHDRTIASFEPVEYSPVTQVLDDHDRQRSIQWSGLPTAPHRTRSPGLRLPSSKSRRSRLLTVSGVWSPVHLHPSKQTSNDTVGLQGSPNSALSAELSPYRYAHGSVAPEPYTVPMFSAGYQTFRSPISPPPHPATTYPFYRAVQ